MASILRTLLVVAFLSHCSANTGPRWWRVSNGLAHSMQWYMCDLRFYGDQACSEAVRGVVQNRRISDNSGWEAGSGDQVLAKYASACDPCTAGEASVAVQYTTPTVVQCVSFSSCAAMGSTSTTTTGTAASTAAPGPTTTTTTLTVPTTTVTTTTTTDPFAIFQRLRRLQVSPNDASADLDTLAKPSRLLLERSSDGGTWTSVGYWNAPYGGSLSLLQASGRPVEDRPLATLWDPIQRHCSLCATNTDGVTEEQTLSLTFQQRLYRGYGNVRISRQGQGVQQVSVSDTTWFDLVDSDGGGSEFKIQPQSSWGLSSTCVEITIDEAALVNQNGLAIVPGTGHTVCVRDSIAPEVQSSYPASGAMNVELEPENLQLAFNEEVQINENAAAATLAWTVNGGSEESLTWAWSGPAIRVFAWSSGRDAVDLRLFQPLAQGASYELRIPAGAITDKSGNAYAGGTVLRFNTVGLSPSPGGGTTAAPGGDDGDPEDDSGSGAIIWVVVFLAIVICGSVAAIAAYLWWRKQKHGKKEDQDRVFTAPNSAKSSRVEPEPLTARSTGTTKTAPAPPAGVPPTTPAAPPNTEQPGANAQQQPGPRQAAWAGGAAGGGPKANQWKAEQRPPRATPGHPGRYNEAEDVQDGRHRRPPPPPFNQGKRRQAGFTDESADAGDWVKTADPETGRPYYFNKRTKEARWDKPPSSKAGAGAPPGDGQQAGAGLAPDISNLEDAEDVAREKENVYKQLDQTRNEEASSRKKTFKFLCLRWHPDKNPDDAELATAIFQFLQQQRGWYLKEEEGN